MLKMRTDDQGVNRSPHRDKSEGHSIIFNDLQ